MWTITLPCSALSTLPYIYSDCIFSPTHCAQRNTSSNIALHPTLCMKHRNSVHRSLSWRCKETFGCIFCWQKATMSKNKEIDMSTFPSLEIGSLYFPSSIDLVFHRAECDECKKLNDFQIPKANATAVLAPNHYNTMNSPRNTGAHAEHIRDRSQNTLRTSEIIQILSREPSNQRPKAYYHYF